MSNQSTTMTLPYHYTDHNSVRRLTQAELQNPQLRPDNKHLRSYLEVPTMKQRPHNPQAIREERTEYITDYPNEAPVVREHNNALLAGGDFWSGLQNFVSGAVPVLSKIL